MRDAAYCRSQARKCRELAIGIGDPGMVEHLLLIAGEYEAEAERLDAARGDGPPDPLPIPPGREAC